MNHITSLAVTENRPRLHSVLHHFRCWSPPCPKVAVAEDVAGWYWCQEHLDRNLAQGEGEFHEVRRWITLKDIADEGQKLLDKARELPIESTQV